MQYIDYTTIEGDRLDRIAYAARDNAFDYADILRENLYQLQPWREIGLNSLTVLPSGITLRVPAREGQTAESANLPPWKI